MGRRFDPSSTVFTVALVLLLNVLFYAAFVTDDGASEGSTAPTLSRGLAAKGSAARRAHARSKRSEVEPVTEVELAADAPEHDKTSTSLTSSKTSKTSKTSEADDHYPSKVQASNSDNVYPSGLTSQLNTQVNTGATILWTERSLTDVGLSIPALFATHAQGKHGKQDLPVARMRIGANQESHTVAVMSDQGSPTPYILMKDLLTQESTEHKAGDILKLTIDGTKTKRHGKGGGAGARAGSLTLNLASVADLYGRGPLTMHLTPGGWETNASATTWLALPGAAEGDQSVSIQLEDGKDMVSLMPLIRAAHGMSVVSETKSTKQRDGYCFVRRGEVVATLWGAALPTELWSKIATALRASMIYRGSASAFIMAPKSEPDFKKKFEAVSKWFHEPMYVYDSRPGDGRYPVLPATVLNEPQIALYLQNATGIFSRPVQMMSPSAALAH